MKPMQEAKVTAKECIKLIDAALKEFGRYTYFDKGAYEVMDIDAISNRLKTMTKDEILAVLTEVAINDRAGPFLSAIIQSLDGWDNPMADSLFDSTLFQTYY